MNFPAFELLNSRFDVSSSRDRAFCLRCSHKNSGFRLSFDLGTMLCDFLHFCQMDLFLEPVDFEIECIETLANFAFDYPSRMFAVISPSRHIEFGPNGKPLIHYIPMADIESGKGQIVV